ncbi:hypothetical protein E2C01_031015 [Portunus trituberculatus]|uniref:Uncharacterized protein n=1 Tax=Portunus trituberculatus TaxID=210409 RepID=A0A5B7ESI3_PORTR|nr:hypothetical protein [Portunus trituberculatus]
MLREVARHFRSPTREQSDLRTFLVPSPEGDSEAGFEVAMKISYDILIREIGPRFLATGLAANTTSLSQSFSTTRAIGIYSLLQLPLPPQCKTPPVAPHSCPDRQIQKQCNTYNSEILNS